MKGVEARVKLASGSLLEFSGNLAAIRAAANTAGGTVAETSALFNRIARPIRDMGGTAEQARQVLSDVGNALRLSGATAAEASSTLLQFSQALGSGVLRGEELNAILENSPRLAEAVAAGLGVTTGELRRLGEAGALTSAQVLKALQSQSATLAGEAQRLPRTVGQAATALGESFKKFVGEADTATGASAALARGIDFLAKNMGAALVIGAPLAGMLTVLAVRIAATAVATTGLTVAARALGIAAGPIGLIVTAVSLGAAAWSAWSASGKKAAAESGESLAQMTKNFQDFAAKMGEQEKAAAIASLQDKVAEARDKLSSPKFRQSDEGIKLAEDAKQAAAAIDKLAASEQKLVQNRTKERGLFGLDDKGLGALGFLDKDMSDKLKAFDVLYREFTEKRRADNGKLIASTADVREALALLFAQAKTSGDFAAVQNQLEKVIAAKPLASRATFTSQLENAISLKSAADRRELEALTAGLAERLQKEGDFLKSAVDQSLIKVSTANAIARVTAELRQDTGGVAAIGRGNAEAELTAARTLANQKLAALETVAQREQQLIKERMTATQDQVSSEVNGLAGVREARLAALAGQEAEIESKRKNGIIGDAVYRQAIARIADERTALTNLSKQRQDDAQKAAQLETARGTAGIEAARSLARVDAETAVKRRAILEELQAAYKAKFAEALTAYKQYAQEVIGLDQKIANNRLDTAAAINALKRQNQTPEQQAQSLADELASVQEATAKARQDGRQDQVLELLNRQKSLAQQIGGLRGEGIDPEAQAQAGIDALERIGAEAEAILQKQRAAAAAAAEAAAKQAAESAQAMNSLAEQIRGLNERAEISLKPTIDQAALEAAKTAVQQAFAGLTVPVKVVASGLPGAPAPEATDAAPAFAHGGPLPGHAPHDRADNMLYWGTPGEWVIQRPAARYYGSAFLAALNAMKLPKFASGGQIGGSAIDRLRVPALPAGASAAAGNNLTLDFGELGKYHAQASQDTQRALERVFTRAALARGRR